MVLLGELPPTSCQLQNHEHAAGSALESAWKEPSLLEKTTTVKCRHAQIYLRRDDCVSCWELAEILRIIYYISNNQIDPVDWSLSLKNYKNLFKSMELIFHVCVSQSKDLTFELYLLWTIRGFILCYVCKERNKNRQ